MTVRFSHLAVALPLFAAAAAPFIQQAPPAGKVFTKVEYDNAAKFLGSGFNGLVVGGAVNATWLPDERFWYRSARPDGSSQIVLVNPTAKTKTVCTPAIPECAGLGDPNAPGAGAGAAGGRGGRGGRAGGGGGRGGGAGGAAPVNVSPDGTKGVFIRDWNLWVRDMASGAERQLTKDGVESFGYATDNAGWTKSANAMVLWSPDSKRVATQQQDERNVGMHYMVSTNVGHPTLQQWKYRCRATRTSNGAPRGDHRRRQRHGHAPEDAAGLSSRDARRQPEHERLRVEAGRHEARARLNQPLPQGRDVQDRGRGHG